MVEKRLHVHGLISADRLLCGRPVTGQTTVSLQAAPAYGNLCSKCRDRLGLAYMLLAVRAEPKTGLQLTFWDIMEGL